VFKKLGKSLVAARPIAKGQVIGLDDLSGRIFSEQIVPVRRSNEVIGATALRDIPQGEAVRPEDFGRP
jgi:flagella basal body P-ring formation protein FlgA